MRKKLLCVKGVVVQFMWSLKAKPNTRVFLSCKGSKVLNIVLPKLGIGFSNYKTEHCKLQSLTHTAVVRGEFSTCGNAIKQPKLPPDKFLSSPISRLFCKCGQ